MNRGKKELLGASMSILLILLLVFNVFLSDGKTKKIDTKKGVAEVEKLGATPVSDVETAINQIATEKEAARLAEEAKNNTKDTGAEADVAASTTEAAANLNTRLDGVIFMGDSQVKALEDYAILDPSHIVADNGDYLAVIDGKLQTAISLNPKVIVLCYGMNDAGWYYEDKFIELYEHAIDTLQAALPDTKIVVSAILNATPEGIAKRPQTAIIPSFNTYIKDMCTRKNIQLIDGSDYLSGQIYVDDGIHRTKDFYRQWCGFVADELGR